MNLDPQKPIEHTAGVSFCSFFSAHFLFVSVRLDGLLLFLGGVVVVATAAADREAAERVRLVHHVRGGGAGAMDGAKAGGKAHLADRYDTGAATDTHAGTGSATGS